MRFPVLLYVQLTLSHEPGSVLLERLSFFYEQGHFPLERLSSFYERTLLYRSCTHFFINSVSNFLNDFPHSISKTTFSNQNIHSSHPLQLFSKSKKSHSPIDMESGLVNMIHLLFAVRKLVRMRIDKMRFHLFHRVLYQSEA